MSRWKRIALKALLFLAILGGTLYFARHAIGGVLIGLAMPAFDPADAPSPPDYAERSAWAAWPDREDAADRLPEDFDEAPCSVQEQVDVFYVHPTGFMGRDRWNGTVGEESSYGIPTSVMLAGQASAFNGCGRVYAPAYRQASIFAYIEILVSPQRGEGYQALDLAYSDVARAFDYFIAEQNGNRPFILASHSQGSVHALRLLAEKIDNTPLQERLIAAYVVGVGMPVDYFDRVYEALTPCTAPDELGCVIAWDTVREGAWRPAAGVHWYPTGWEQAWGKATLNINPLSWTDSPEQIAAEANRGALMGRMVSLEEDPHGVEILGVSPAHTWARIEGCCVSVADQEGTPFHDAFGIYHLFDYNLFWGNIRENACARAEAWFAARPQIAAATN